MQEPPGLLAALAGTSTAVAVFDEDLRLVWATDPYFELLSLDRSVIGSAVSDLAIRGENLPFFEALEATAADGCRRTVRNDSGDYGITLDNVISRVGQYTVIEVDDVTATVRAEALQRLMGSAKDAVTDHMSELVIMIDFQQQSVVTNEPCTDAFGDFEWLSQFIASGRPFEDLQLQFPIDDPEGQLQAAFEIGVGVMQTGVPFQGVLDLPTLNGLRIFQVVATRWEHEGQVRGLIDLKTDITDAVMAHRRNEAAQQEVAAMSQVRNFAQGVAHDFGNVAQVVKGYAQLLQAHPSQEVTTAAVASLSAVADRSVRLAHDISEIARIGEVPSRPVHLNALVNDHLPQLQRAAGEGVEVTLTTTGDALAMANGAAIQSILDNLCENATRAMGGQGAIRICVTEADDRAVMQICDDGPGIPSAMQDRIFEPFNSSPSSRAAGGTGLGLYLLNEYVKFAQGELAVNTSRLGTTFTISLPLAAEASTESSD